MFDLHVSLVHGRKMKIKQKNFEENPKVENSHSNEVMDESLKCDICDSPFKSEGSLKKHIGSVHEWKKPFKCNKCESGFSKKSSLNTHIRSVHDL